MPKKEGPGQFVDLRGVGKKEEVVFLRGREGGGGEGVDIPMPTMVATDIEDL